MSQPKGQVFEAGGNRYDVQKLWELSKGKPVERLAVQDAQDYMNARSWTGGRTPNEILEAGDDTHGHMTRINKSNLRYPVLLAPNQGAIDGMHRMAKATKMGKDTIPVRRFTSWEQMAPALVKEAVTTEQLAAGAKRMRKIRIPNMTALLGEHAPGMAGVAPWYRVKKPFQEAIDAYLPEIERLYGPEAAQGALKTVQDMAGVSRQASGNVIAAPGGTVRTIQRIGPRHGLHMPKLSPKEQKSFNLIGMSHESAEVGIPRNATKLDTGHADPSVLMKEHNLLTRAEDAPLQGAAEAMRSLRTARPGGEGDFMKNLMEAAYPGTSFEYGRGQKITKAMRKDLHRRLHTEIVPEMARKAQEAAGGVVKSAEVVEDGEHKLQGRTNFQGLSIAIENRKGSVRKGTGKDGKEWRTKMRHPYGYIEAPAKGKDGDSIDAYVGPDKKAPHAFVVHQHKEDGTGHDEDKVMLGFKSKADAKKAYLAHYDSPKFLGPVSRVSVERLRELVAAKKRLVKIATTAAISDDDHFSVAVGKRISSRLDKKNPNRPRYASLKDFILRLPDPRYDPSLSVEEAVAQHEKRSSREDVLLSLLKQAGGVPELNRLPADVNVAKQKMLDAIQKSKDKSWSHPQISLPHNKVDLKRLGFESTRLAIPLPGEMPFSETWRAGRLHAHKQGDRLLMHADAVAPDDGFFATVQHLIEDVPPAIKMHLTKRAMAHAFTKEAIGLPGMGTFGKVLMKGLPKAEGAAAKAVKTVGTVKKVPSVVAHAPTVPVKAPTPAPPASGVRPKGYTPTGKVAPPAPQQAPTPAAGSWRGGTFGHVQTMNDVKGLKPVPVSSPQGMTFEQAQEMGRKAKAMDLDSARSATAQYGQEQFAGAPRDIREAIMRHPNVAQHGMHPSSAYAALSGSREARMAGGQGGVYDAVRKQLGLQQVGEVKSLGSSPGFGTVASPASATMATRATVAPPSYRSMATVAPPSRAVA